MQFSFVLIALAAAVDAAAVLSRGIDLPECAVPCIQASIKKMTTCDETDLACTCKSFGKIQGDATGCIVGKCGIEVAINKVLPAVKLLCKTY